MRCESRTQKPETTQKPLTVRQRELADELWHRKSVQAIIDQLLYKFHARSENHPDHDDLMSQAHIAILRAAQSLDENPDIRDRDAFIATVIQREFIRFVKSKHAHMRVNPNGRVPPNLSSIQGLHDKGDDLHPIDYKQPDERLQDEEMRSKSIAIVFDTVAKQAIDVFSMLLEGNSIKTIAEELDMTENAVKQQLHRIRHHKALRQRLENLHEPSDSARRAA